MNLAVILPLQFFVRVREALALILYMIRTIHLWKYPVLDFSFLETFWLFSQFPYVLLNSSYFLCLCDSVLLSCKLLGIYPFFYIIQCVGEEKKETKPICWAFKFLVIVFTVLKSHLTFLYIFYFFFETVFSYMPSMFISADLKHFYDDCFNLCQINLVSVISVLASIDSWFFFFHWVGDLHGPW